MQQQKTQISGPLSTLEYLRVVKLSEAARLSGLCTRTLKDRYGHKLVRRGRQVGMRIGDALQLPPPWTTDDA